MTASPFQLIYRGKRFVRLFILICLFLVFVVIFSLLAGLTIFDRQHNHIIHDYVARNDDIAVLSTTIFSESKSYAPNTAVILFNAVQVFHLKHTHLNVIAETAQGNVHIKFRIEPVIRILPFFCKWVPYTASGVVPADHVLLKLSTNNRDGMELSLRNPRRTPRRVVACFSPLFLNERWQLLLATIEVYGYYGAFMQFYIRSMITDLFELVKSNKNVRVSPWPAIRFGEQRVSPLSFDPNKELEFRNQAAAMTDCLLLYKESADFVIFPDPDDIIIPSLGATYEQEFIKAFEMFPLAGAIAYNMTEVSIESTTNPSSYSPLSLLNSIQFKGKHRWGKLVVRPERVNSVWIHRSFGIREGFEQHTMPVDINAAMHFREWHFKEIARNDPRDPPLFGANLSNSTNRPVFKLSDGLQIEQNFKSRIANSDVSSVYSRLPSIAVYYPLIETCYNRIFYSQTGISTCRGPEYCHIPQFSGLRCTNVQSEFVTYKSYENVFIHQLISNNFEESDNGCTL